MNNNEIQSLVEFIQKAIKLAKYNANTGNGLLNAVRTAERGFLPEEPKQIDYLVGHMEELFLRQRDMNLSPQSLAVYFTRIRRAVEDYSKYGTDARSIYSWSPKQRIKKVSSKSNSTNNEDVIDDSEKLTSPSLSTNSDQVIKEVGGVKLNVVTWRLRPGVMVKVELPQDLTKADVQKIKKLLDLEIEEFE